MTTASDLDDLVPTAKSWQRQFHVGRSPPLRGGWESQHAVGSQTLTLYPGATARPVQDRSGAAIGYLLGTAIDPDRRAICKAPLTFDGPASPAGLDAAIESFAYRLTGSWLLVIAAGGEERIYLDADGSLSLVYDPEGNAAAATTGLLLDDTAYRSRFDATLYNALGVAGEGWFPSGLTAHAGIKRLLCNHYLDLKTWRAQRHWPKQDFTWTKSTRDHSVRIAEIVSNTTAALIADGNTVSALTGGNETRFLLAAFGDQRDKLDFVTVSSPATQRDVVLAKRLAAMGRLKHRLLPLVEAGPDDQAAWRYRSSHGITGPNMVSHPSIAPLASYKWFIGGLGGEIGRAFFWRPADTESLELDAATLVPRFGMPVHEAVVEATRTWHEPIAGLNALTRLDLAYLELRMSAWAFAQEYAVNTVRLIHPMIGREAYRLMLELPPEAKRRNAVITEGVRALWPELLQVPINQYGDYRDVLQVLSRATKPGRVAKKLRKMFG